MEFQGNERVRLAKPYAIGGDASYMGIANVGDVGIVSKKYIGVRPAKVVVDWTDGSRLPEGNWIDTDCLELVDPPLSEAEINEVYSMLGLDPESIKLTEREARLVREAAVLGFVEGAFMAGGIEDFPKDSQIVERVMVSAEQNKDLYPTLSKVVP